jgi:hypothetical protein
MSAPVTAPHGYRPGGAYGSCDRCSYKFRHAALRKEWTGLLVCSECWDPKPADLAPPRVYPEGLPVRDMRPDPGDVLGPNTTTRDDL